MRGRGLHLINKEEVEMIEIELTNEQMKGLQTEFDKAAVAWEKGKTGILFMQIWPNSALAKGHFLPEKVSTEMINVMNKYEKEIKEALKNGIY